MDIKTLCLGVLTMGEASGYEIKKVFEDAFSHFYVAGYGSIYPALAELTRDNLVTVQNIEQHKRPAKKVYSLTERGRSTFNQALNETYPTHRVRSDFLALMMFAHLLDTAQLNQVFDARIQDIERQIGAIESCLNDPDTCAASTGARFTAGFGFAVLNAAKQYIGENRTQFIHELEQQKE